MATNAKLMRVGDVAEALGLSPSSVYRKVWRGELPALQLGGPGTSLRFDRHEIESWVYETLREAKAAGSREAGSAAPEVVALPPNPATSATGFPAGPVATGPDKRAREDGPGRASGREEPS